VGNHFIRFEGGSSPLGGREPVHILATDCYLRGC